MMIICLMLAMISMVIKVMTALIIIVMMVIPDRLPDVLKAESYAFVALPAEAFWDGQVNDENIKRGGLWVIYMDTDGNIYIGLCMHINI